MKREAIDSSSVDSGEVSEEEVIEEEKPEQETEKPEQDEKGSEKKEKKKRSPKKKEKPTPPPIGNSIPFDQPRTEKNYRKYWLFFLLIGICNIVVVVLRLVFQRQEPLPQSESQTFTMLKNCLGSSLVSKDMTDLIVLDHHCNSTIFPVLDLSEFSELQYVNIGAFSFTNVNSVIIRGLKSLKRVIVGNTAFSLRSGNLTIADCPSLTKVTVGEDAFRDFDQLTLSQVPSLETLSLGDGSFTAGNELVVEDLRSLKEVTVGAEAFSKKSGRFVVRNCPAVKLLQFGVDSFALFSAITIENAPALESLSFGNSTFTQAGDLTLAGLDALRTITVDDHAFGEGNGTLTVRNCPALRVLQAGSFAFSGYTFLVVDATPALEVIETGSFAFVDASLLNVTGFVSLVNLTVGANSFLGKNSRLLLSNCPRVEILRVGEESFSGDAESEFSDSLVLRSIHTRVL